MIIRPERDGDAAAIGLVTELAFAGKPYSDQTEHRIVERLRQAGTLAMSIVAEEAGHILGHAAFSLVTIEDGAQGWYGLGPVSVHPDRQRQGIGSLLIREGLTQLAAQDASGCVVVGSPLYYPKFGFRQAVRLIYPGLSAEYFTVLPLQGFEPSGIVQFHSAFYGDAAD